MTIYNFYAEPKDNDDLIIVTPNPSIHSLKFILIDNGKYIIGNDNHSTYKLVNEPLTKDCLVEEHHYYKVLRLGWTKDNPPDNWQDEDTIPFSCIVDPVLFIKGIKEFFNKEFIIEDFVFKLQSDSDFKYVTEQILGNDIDYVDMYFDRKREWKLTNISIKEIRTIRYKNSNEY